MSWKETIAPLRTRNFAWYYAARMTDTVGAPMATVALAFAVLDLTDSATALGQVLAAHTIALVAFLLFGGVIGDRFPRAVVLQVSNLSAALTQGVMAALVISDREQLWMLMVLAGLNGAGDAVGSPAMASLVPQLVPRDQLQTALALLGLSRSGLSILGPSIGALLVVTAGPGWALALGSLCWLLSALLLTAVRIPARATQTQSAGMIAELREGWALFTGTTWLWVVVLSFGFLNAIHVGALSTLGPAVAENTIGRSGWGLVLSAEAAGLMVATAVLLRVRLERPLLWGMLACLPMSVPMVLLGVSPEVVTLVVTAFVAGAGISVFNLGWNLAMQENIDESQLSRAYSYDMLGSFVAMPIGALAYGPLAAAFGYRDVLVVSAIAYVAISLATLASRPVRTLQRRSSNIDVASG
ncbi:MAG: MFS transporter [Sporichthyaceae bacterium]